jgi:DNA-binding NarL/FixJ family response regulator
MTIRVLVADDQALVRAGFRMIIDDQDDMRVVAEADNGAEAVDLARQSGPDVILMDIRMPVMDGIEATRKVLAGSSGATPRIVILTTYDLDEYVFEALAAGASGFLLKDVTPEDLVRAVRVTAHGDALLAPSITRRLLEQFARARPTPSNAVKLETLTERELEVLRLLGRGKSNAEIAAALFVGESTVKTHVGHVFDKLAVRDRAQAAIFAYEAGVVRPGEDDAAAS